MASQSRDLQSFRGRRTPRVRRLESKEEILALLENDRLYATVQVAELEGSTAEQYDCFIAEDEEEIGLCLYQKNGRPESLFLMGAESGVAVVLGSALRPPYVNITCEQRHLAVLQAHYRTGEPEPMIRMVVSKARFKPTLSEVAELGARDIEEIRDLYRLGGVDTVTAAKVASGVYRGVRESGRLVAVAGTHVISPTLSLGLVANVFTHPEYRNRGYATICTSAVTARLLQDCRDVLLNVNSDNGPAIRVYAKLGYREHCRFAQLVGLRRGTAHLGAFFDRVTNR